MDSNIVNQSDVDEALKICVTNTNRIINRWITVNNTKISNIKNSDIEAIFLGQVRKALFKKENSDFKKISKNTIVFCTAGKFIYSIITNKLEALAVNNTDLVNAYVQGLKNINYLKLMPDEQSCCNLPIVRQSKIEDEDLNIADPRDELISF